MRRWDDGTPAGMPGWQGIEVDPTSLHGLAGTVDADMDANVRPRTSHLMCRYGSGVTFGVTGLGGSVSDARARYHDCLSATVRQLAGFVNGSLVLARAARAVAANYVRADALAAGGTDAVSAGEVTRVLTETARLDATVPVDALDGNPPGAAYR